MSDEVGLDREPLKRSNTEAEKQEKESGGAAQPQARTQVEGNGVC